MAQRYTPFVAQPKLGGALMTNVSSEEAGLFNYVTKRNFRREMDAEKRREGYDYFWPNVTGDFLTNPVNQPFPNNVTEKTVTLLTRVGSVATATFTEPHEFSEGETVIISGSGQDPYNGTFQVYDVTRLAFSFDVVGVPISPSTGTVVVKSDEPINLVHLARRPNGKTAVIVGTPTRLFRYYALENGDYVSTDPDDYPAGETALYWSIDPSVYPPGEDPAYVDNNPGDWLQIGHGFSPEGQRWEAVNINGWAVFNNGVDLPVTYRVEDIAVVPIYEMREQGIASVGTIAELSGILMVADISEIFEDKLVELFDMVGIRRGGDVLMSQSGTVATANEDFFAADGSDIGQYIVYSDGTEVKIIAPYISQTQANVDTSATVTETTFNLRPKLSQVGNEYSGTITATQGVGSSTVTSSAPFFNAGMVGKDLRYTNGWDTEITGFVDTTHVTVGTPAPAGSDFTNLSFYVSDGASSGYADYMMVSTAPIFTDQMIGRNILLDSGIVRRIEAYVSSTQVRVDTDMPIAASFGGVENIDSYGRYTETQFINRIQYRVAWSMVDLPRRWGPIIPASITIGGSQVRLDYAVKSFESGQQVLIVGAGTNGGNLTANILYAAGGLVVSIDDFALATTTDGFMEQADVPGSIIGFEDLQDDSSGILRMMELQGTLVIYKDTSIFLGNYTGIAATPFIFKLRHVPNGKTLYYRYTLLTVNTAFHVYAGRNSFYRYDLTNQIPQEIDIGEFCKDVFFSQATLANTNQIFAADNSITKEAFIVFPSETSDKMLAFDYQHSTFSTSDMEITAANIVKRPEVGISIGESEDWFVMGTGDGVVLLYGLSDENVDAWNAEEIIYRRSANPFTSTTLGYDSTLKPGLSNFADPVNEKDTRSYTLILSSHSPDGEVAITFYGTRNTAEPESLLASYDMDSPSYHNLVPLHFRAGYFREQLVISGKDNPLQILQRIWDISPVITAGHARRPV